MMTVKLPSGQVFPVLQYIRKIEAVMRKEEVIKKKKPGRKRAYKKRT